MGEGESERGREMSTSIFPFIYREKEGEKERWKTIKKPRGRCQLFTSTFIFISLTIIFYFIAVESHDLKGHFLLFLSVDWQVFACASRFYIDSVFSYLKILPSINFEIYFIVSVNFLHHSIFLLPSFSISYFAVSFHFSFFGYVHTFKQADHIISRLPFSVPSMTLVPFSFLEILQHFLLFLRSHFLVLKKSSTSLNSKRSQFPSGHFWLGSAVSLSFT